MLSRFVATTSYLRSCHNFVADLAEDSQIFRLTGLSISDVVGLESDLCSVVSAHTADHVSFKSHFPCSLVVGPVCVSSH